MTRTPAATPRNLRVEYWKLNNNYMHMKTLKTKNGYSSPECREMIIIPQARVLDGSNNMPSGGTLDEFERYDEDSNNPYFG